MKREITGFALATIMCATRSTEPVNPRNKSEGWDGKREAVGG